MNSSKRKILNTLFLDIETVSNKSSFEELSESQKMLWKIKANQLTKFSSLALDEQTLEDLYTEKAAIYSEFGKIICISVGIYKKFNGGYIFKKKSFLGNTEKEILNGFLDLIRRKFNNNETVNFCGHNVQEFDIPYICRRSLINGFKIPNSLNISGKKQWQIKHIKDTLQLWKFGDYKHYTSLALLCDIFNIPTPKSSMDGSMVNEKFWHENNSESIKSYCEQDVEAVAMLYCKMIGAPEFLNAHNSEMIGELLN